MTDTKIINEITNETKTTRIAITSVNQIIVYINQNCLILSNAQNAANIVIKNDNNKNNNLINEKNEI